MKPRLLIVCTTFKGAITNFTDDLFRYLSPHFELYAVLGYHTSVPERIHDCLLIDLGKNKKAAFFPSTYRRVSLFIQSIQPACVMFCSGSPLHNVIWQLANGYKRIAYIHDPIPHSGMAFLRGFFYRRLLGGYYKKADCAIFSSYFLRNMAVGHGLIERERTDVAHLGLLSAHRLEVEDSERDIDFLFYGRIERYKGLDILFQALGLCRQKGLEPKVMLLGKGDIQAVFPEVKEIPGNITRVEEYIEDCELVKIVARAKYVILPYRDATGTQIIQTAYWCKTPVVITDAGALPEYANPEIAVVAKAGDVESLASSIETALSDGQWDSRSLRARSYVEEHFTEECVAGEYQRIVSKVIAGEAHARH